MGIFNKKANKIKYSVHNNDRGLIASQRNSFTSNINEGNENDSSMGKKIEIIDSNRNNDSKSSDINVDSNIDNNTNNDMKGIKCYPSQHFFSQVSHDILQVSLMYPLYKRTTTKNNIAPTKKGMFVFNIASRDKDSSEIIDWENKSSISLSVENIGKVLYCLSNHKGMNYEEEIFDTNKT